MNTAKLTRRAAAAMLLGALLAGAQAPPAAGSLLSGAEAEARQSQRAVFAIFHASW